MLFFSAKMQPNMRKIVGAVCNRTSPEGSTKPVRLQTAPTIDHQSPVDAIHIAYFAKLAT
jgi:hypothetical protein